MRPAEFGRSNRKGNVGDVEERMLPAGAAPVFKERLPDHSRDSHRDAAPKVQIENPGNDEHIVHRQRGKNPGQPNFEPGGQNGRERIQQELDQFFGIARPLCEEEGGQREPAEHDSGPIYSGLFGHNETENLY